MANGISVEILVNGTRAVRAGLDGLGYLECRMVLGRWAAPNPTRFEISGMQNDESRREVLQWAAPATAIGDTVQFRILRGGVTDPPTSRWDETVYERGLLGAPHPAPMLAENPKSQRLFGRFVKSDLSNALTMVVVVNEQRRACIGDSGDDFLVVGELWVVRESANGGADETVQLTLFGMRGIRETHRWTPIALNVGDVVDLRLGDGAIVDEPSERFAVPKSGT